MEHAPGAGEARGYGVEKAPAVNCLWHGRQDVTHFVSEKEGHLGGHTRWIAGAQIDQRFGNEDKATGSAKALEIPRTGPR